MTTRRAFITTFLPALTLAAGFAAAAEPSPSVRLVRTPDGGIQPQAVAGPDGAIHLIYFKGEHRGGDVYYVRSGDGGGTFSKPMRVNDRPATVIAAGGVRGAHLALGRGGRVHVAWMGARPKPEGQPGHDHHGDSPMWYTRLSDSGERFEPQRNLLTVSGRLDGGGSVAADEAGNVYVAWHGVSKDIESPDESKRQIWVAASRDEGKTFKGEEAITPLGPGVCACCGMRAAADARGRLIVLHRSATGFIHRDMMVNWSADAVGAGFKSAKLDAWEVNRCPMSTAAIATDRTGSLLAWETDGRIFAARFDSSTGQMSASVEAPGDAAGKKHPTVAVQPDGPMLLAWTEGTGWNRGGSLAWQAFDAAGKPLASLGGRRGGVPAFSLVSAAALPSGGFVVFY